MTKTGKSKLENYLLISFALIVTGAGLYLGIKALKGTKKAPVQGGGNPPQTGGNKNTVYTNAGTNTNVSYTSSDFPLRMGSRNTYVSQLQNSLQGLGQNITADGIFGSQTQAALVAVTGKSTVDSAAELEAIRMKQYPTMNVWDMSGLSFGAN